MAEGVVKWFSAEKGYGFITPDDGGKDLFVHFSGVGLGLGGLLDGYGSLDEGHRVNYEPQEAPRGRRPRTSHPSSSPTGAAAAPPPGRRPPRRQQGPLITEPPLSA